MEIAGLKFVEEDVILSALKMNVNDMVWGTKLTPEQEFTLLRQSMAIYVKNSVAMFTQTRMEMTEAERAIREMFTAKEE